MRPHFNSVFDLQINNSRHLFVLNFAISGKVKSLHKVIKYVKRSKSSFHEFQRKTYAKCNFKESYNVCVNIGKDHHSIQLKIQFQMVTKCYKSCCKGVFNLNGDEITDLKKEHTLNNYNFIEHN